MLVAGHELGMADPFADFLGMALAFAIRGLALARGLSLPVYRPRVARSR